MSRILWVGAVIPAVITGLWLFAAGHMPTMDTGVPTAKPQEDRQSAVGSGQSEDSGPARRKSRLPIADLPTADLKRLADQDSEQRRLIHGLSQTQLKVSGTLEQVQAELAKLHEKVEALSKRRPGQAARPIEPAALGGKPIVIPDRPTGVRDRAAPRRRPAKARAPPQAPQSSWFW